MSSATHVFSRSCSMHFTMTISKHPNTQHSDPFTLCRSRISELTCGAAGLLDAKAVATKTVMYGISALLQPANCMGHAAATHLNSTRPSFMPRIAGTMSATMVPSLALGMSPRGPSTWTMALDSFGAYAGGIRMRFHIACQPVT